jgi:cytochrome c553
MPVPSRFFLLRPALALCVCTAARADDFAATYQDKILPILEDHCFSCHGEGEDKGKISFDTFGSTEELLKQTSLWEHALRNIRAGLMPPAKKKRPSEEDLATLEAWIKRGPLNLDPANPDPGRVTLRRLNRVEYRNTIKDLTGHDFRSDEEFPADDTGYGFDNIGDVLSTSPLLLEKYMQAAETIVAKSMPMENRVIPQRNLPAGLFRGKGEGGTGDWEYRISLYDPADLTAELKIETPGTYRLVLNATARGSFSYDPGRANATWSVEGRKLVEQELKWSPAQKMESSIEMKWEAGTYPLRLTLQPLVDKSEQPPDLGDGPPSVNLHLNGITLIGPMEPEHKVHPPNYERFFTRDSVPEDAAGREQYAAEIIRRFATRAYRRPVDEATIQKLTGFAKQSMEAPDSSFEKGAGRAIAAILASPRFLFRMESTLPTSDPAAHPLLDEYSLASRLSYFLWSTTPDDTLYQLAGKGELRKNLAAQVERMLKDERSDEFVKNFAGQWLQTRDVEGVSIDARVVLSRDSGTEKENNERFQKFRELNKEIDEAEKAGNTSKVAALREEMGELRKKFRGQRRVEFGGSLRTAMRREAEMYFRHLLREDRSVLELIETDSTFLNGELAAHYGIPGVDGGDMRLVKLPPDSPRGGIITMGSVLAVTSNPTRTSPVKRGLFILDNVLGTPPPPAPPDIPSLEASEKTADGRELTLREALAMHREKPLCSSCHNRMDPLGLALENFNAMGLWRDKERGQTLASPAGQLITGEMFKDVRELKHLLVTARREDYYRCLTEKLLTYALGRGPQPCDITTVDSIVEQMEQSGGKFSTLITGIIESAPFQKRQRPST